MANIPEPTPEWAEIYQLEKVDQAIAGPNGIMNQQAKQLMARANLLLDRIEALEANNASVLLVPPPSALAWQPPVNVYKQGGSFSTNFNPDAWKPITTATIWVSPTGNDTTGNGSQATPYRSPKKAWQIAAGLADNGIAIRILPGIYDRNMTPGNTACDKDLLVTAEGSGVVFSQRFEPQTWTLDTAGVYRATRGAVITVEDETWLDARGAIRRLDRKNTLAECQGQAGSWYTDGTTLYVHAIDNRLPDASILVMASVGNTIFAGNHRWYFDGVTFEGGNASAFAVTSAPSIGASASTIFVRCTFRCGGGTDGNGLGLNSVALSICYLCTAYSNGKDGFNYHFNSRTGRCIEINCVSYSNGTSGDTSDNATTIHEDGKILRVNGNYHHTIGPVLADINTAMSWNLGCTCGPSLLGDSSAVDADVYALNNAIIWLDSCVVGGSYWSANANSASATVYYRNTTLSRSGGNVLSY